MRYKSQDTRIGFCITDHTKSIYDEEDEPKIILHLANYANIYDGNRFCLDLFKRYPVVKRSLFDNRTPFLNITRVNEKISVASLIQERVHCSSPQHFNGINFRDAINTIVNYARIENIQLVTFTTQGNAFGNYDSRRVTRILRNCFWYASLTGRRSKSLIDMPPYKVKLVKCNGHVQTTCKTHTISFPPRIRLESLYEIISEE